MRLLARYRPHGISDAQVRENIVDADDYYPAALAAARENARDGEDLLFVIPVALSDRA